MSGTAIGKVDFGGNDVCRLEPGARQVSSNFHSAHQNKNAQIAVFLKRARTLAPVLDHRLRGDGEEEQSRQQNRLISRKNVAAASAICA